MKKISLAFAPVLLAVFLTLPGVCSAQHRDGTSASVSKAATLKKYGIDPASDLLSRVQDTSPEVIEKFKKAGMSPRRHELSKEDRIKIANAFAGLPPLHQRLLKERLRSISFLDNMPNTALTSTINMDSPYRLYDMTFRAAILNQTVSEWTTEKENTLFKPDSLETSVSIEAGTLDAIFYVLLHESTHVLDGALGLTENEQPAPKSQGLFSHGVWTARTETVPVYTDSLLQQVNWRKDGKLSLTDQAPLLYRSLMKTPFVSVYGSTARPEDLAEYLSVYHLTEKLKQPFRIVVRRNGKEDFVYEPMKSKLVRSRIGLMKQFYNPKS